MYFPNLIPYNVKRVILKSFGAINRAKRCDENEFTDTLNLCSSHYPLLHTSPMKYRLGGFECEGENVGVFDNNGIGAVHGKSGAFRIDHNDESTDEFEYKGELNPSNLFNFNAKTLIIGGGDAYEFDPADMSVDRMGVTLDIEAGHVGVPTVERTLKLSLVYNDGGEIGRFTTGTEDDAFPSDASENDLIAKNLTFYRLVSKSPSVNASDQWQVQTSFRLRLDIPKEYRCFKAGDYIRIRGLKYWNWGFRTLESLERFIRIEDIDDAGRYITQSIDIFIAMIDILTEKKFPTNDIGLYDRPIIDNDGNELCMLEGELSACMPKLDHAIPGANRVWGCSNDTREIFACELGNARNWSCFEGLSSDSYAVSVASYGDFTACINYLGTPIFFKENEMVVIDGSRPSNYRVSSYSCKGVSKDSPSGLCVVDDILYYKSHDGIYAYSGSLPVCVSLPVEDIIAGMKNVVMAGEGSILFVSGHSEKGDIHLSYDTVRRLWHGYSSGKTLSYLRYPDATLELCREGERAVFYSLYKGIPADCGLKEESALDIDWFFESGDISYSTTDRKYISRITLDTECSSSSTLLISYNGGIFKKLKDLPMHQRGKCDIALFPERCDYFRIRMEGQGEFTLFAMTKEIEEVREGG